MGCLPASKNFITPNTLFVTQSSASISLGVFSFAVKCLATLSILADATNCIPPGLALKAVFFPHSVGACSAWFAQ